MTASITAPRALTRRSALTGAAFAALAGASVLARPVRALAAGAAAPLNWTPKTLTPREALVVDAVCAVIMPATDTPGAREAGVPQRVDQAFGDFYQPATVAVLRAGLAQIDADARATGAAGFPEMSPAAQLELLTKVDKAAAASLRQRSAATHYFITLKQLVLTEYYSSKPGASVELKYDALPGAYHACVPYKDIGRAWATA
jgi:hypothetical protein